MGYNLRYGLAILWGQIPSHFMGPPPIFKWADPTIPPKQIIAGPYYSIILHQQGAPTILRLGARANLR